MARKQRETPQVFTGKPLFNLWLLLVYINQLNSYLFVFHRKNELMIDHWEVDGDLVTLEDEIGGGAFGKVYKGTLVKPTNVLPQKFSLKPWKKTVKTISGSETYVVAVKMLHGE